MALHLVLHRAGSRRFIQPAAKCRRNACPENLMTTAGHQPRRQGLRGVIEHAVDASLIHRSISQSDRPALPQLALFS
jgi:hypothetical protein